MPLSTIETTDELRLVLAASVTASYDRIGGLSHFARFASFAAVLPIKPLNANKNSFSSHNLA